MWDYDGPNITQHHLDTILQLICKKLTIILKEKNHSTSNICLKTRVLKAITELIENVPKYFLDYAEKMFTSLWKTLMDTAKTYRQCMVNGSRDFGIENQYSDGETVNDYDNVTLISEAETILAYLSVAALQAIKYKHIYGKTGSQYILQIAPYHMNIGK